MKIITYAIILLLLSGSLCFASQDCLVSQQTLDNIVQLKHRMDIYAQGAIKEAKQSGASRRDYLTQILNYIVIISGKLDLLLSSLDSEYAQAQEKYVDELSPKETIKFMDFILGRMDKMARELNGQAKLANEALLVHHIEGIKRFFSEGKNILSQAKSELANCK